MDGVKDHALFLFDPEGNIISWNKGAERLKGYPAQEIIGRNSALCFTPEDVPGRTAAAAGMAAERGTIQGRMLDRAARMGPSSGPRY